MKKIGDYIQSLRQAERNLADAIIQCEGVEMDFHFTYDDIYIFDQQCKLMFISFLTAKRFGLMQQQVEGQHVREVQLSRNLAEDLEHELKKVLLTGMSLSKQRKVLTTDGETQYHDFFLKPFYDTAGTVCAVVCTVKDITAQKMLEIETMMQREKLEKVIFNNMAEQENWRQEVARLDRLGLIGEMAAGVAHEIRNPMTVIRGYLQMFMNKAPQEELCKYEMIIEELDRVGELIADYLSIARTGQKEADRQNLNEVIKSICPLIKSEVLKNGVELTLHLDPHLPDQQLNEKEIKQLILNLVRNGLEAVEEKGYLKIETAHLGDIVELTISDNGCGIPKNLLNKIFDPFFTTKDAGTGLGLSVCSDIVQRHGGNMQVLSELGLGTEFCMTFPIQECADNAHENIVA